MLKGNIFIHSFTGDVPAFASLNVPFAGQYITYAVRESDTADIISLKLY